MKLIWRKWIGLLVVGMQCVFPLRAQESPFSEGQVLQFNPPPAENEEEGISINFSDVSIGEFLHFVSKIAEVNFVYDDKILDFHISFVTGKPTDPKSILKILTELLDKQNIKMIEKEGYYLVEKKEGVERKPLQIAKETSQQKGKEEKLTAVNHKIEDALSSFPFAILPNKEEDFFIYKLQYHQGSEVQQAVKQVALGIKGGKENTPDLIHAIKSMQWFQSTNSLLYSGTPQGIEKLSALIKSLDTPKKQVFIEVLVIETDVKNGLEFGLEWGGGGKYKDKIGFGVGNFPASKGKTSFANTLQQINASRTPQGTSDIPIGRGFDLGIIGDVILHKGMSFFSLGSLVSALQADGNNTIVLNQKLITQDNKSSNIFVGDNIPFTGSKVQTVGAAQQTSTNIEYRDVGVKLKITPLLGDQDIITLDITEEITEAIDDMIQERDSVGGIQTTKTDMATQVHVPDKSFLVLSGMIRNTKKYRKSGLPCLGGLPLIGAAFSKMNKKEEKRNIVIFLRPQIIHSFDDYQDITVFQEEQFKKQSGDQKGFEEGADQLKKEGVTYGANHTSSQ